MAKTVSLDSERVGWCDTFTRETLEWCQRQPGWVDSEPEWAQWRSNDDWQLIRAVAGLCNV